MAIYNLHEFDRDKIFTKEIDPKEVNSFKYTPYNTNSTGQIVIDKNINLTGSRKFVSLVTTKTSQSKFNQIVDISFSEFIVKNTGAALDFLQAKINAYETERTKLLSEKDIDKQKIDALNSQIANLQAQLQTQPIDRSASLPSESILSDVKIII
jgi:hypothetical protein